MHMCILYNRDKIRYTYRTFSPALDFLEQRKAKLQAIHLNKTVSSELHTHLPNKNNAMKKKNGLSPAFQLLPPNSCENQSLASVKCLCSTEFSRTKAVDIGWNPRQDLYTN